MIPKGKYCSIIMPCKSLDKLCEYAVRDTLKNKYYCSKYEYRGRYINRVYLKRKGYCRKCPQCLKSQKGE